ncbi:hypothetical protein [Terrisporobacter mayombei]|uniref:Transposase n=1 Tax=Terrisporobacter mayombei TaxID=1541 RepID=A0ABY9Q186_9FIRM|nr:hypothetical protein [Terrisporobacter mayombei]MCC3866924.1 hypothetical protein [Terrisporobacter mayombei]WMT81169.1 hypothetical protein TEMA_15020 [Terrisporobacter mayombei]
MSRKPKVDFKTKIKSVEMYLNGEIVLMAICKMIVVGKTASKNTFYSNEVKIFYINRKRLEAQNKHLEMENAFLKLEEIESRRG